MTNLTIESTATEINTSTENTAMNDTNTVNQTEALAANIAKGKKAPKKSKAQEIADRIAGVSKEAEAKVSSKKSAMDIVGEAINNHFGDKPSKPAKAAKKQTAKKSVATEIVPVPMTPATEIIDSAVQMAVQNARSIHSAMKANFIEGIRQIAEQVIAAKEAAKREGVRFDSLFGNPDDATQFPFSQNWANTIVRVYESNLLFSADLPRLPSDLTTLATLASTKPEKREAVLRRYEEIRTGDFNFIDGEIVLAKVTTQKAMKKAKAEVEGEGEGETPAKAPKQFNAMRMAKSLYKELGWDGLSELHEAIEQVLEEGSN